MKRLRTWLAMLPAAGFLLLFCGGNAIRLERGLDLMEANSRMLDAAGRDVPEAWRGRKAFGDPDAYCWLLAAEDLLARGAWRVRRTHWDNVPYGRQMHWCQLPVWGLAALAEGFMRAAGLPRHAALERAGTVLMPLAGIVFLFAAAWLVRRRWGTAAAALALPCLAASSPVFFAFHPTRPDHHGFQVAFFALAWFSLLAGGLGWRDAGAEGEGAARARRRFFAAAGFSTGCLFWVGATVALFAVAGVCLALGATLLAAGRTDAEGVRWDGGAWRTWGRWAAACSFAFCLVEYAPRHFSMHLEPNHPLHALFLLGLGECIPSLGGWWLGTQKADRRWLAGLAAGLAAVAALPYFLFAARSAGGHAMQTPVMRLMHGGISEFRNLAEFARLGKVSLALAAYSLFGVVPLLLPAAFAAGLWPGRPRAWRLEMLGAAAMAVAFAGLAVWQVRWGPMAQVAAVAPCFLLLVAARRAGRRWRRAAGLAVALPLLAYAAESAGDLLRLTRHAEEASRVDGSLLGVAWFDRVQALRLRAAMERAEGEGAAERARLVLPVSSGPAFAWHGGFRSLGSLYWENVSGVADQYRILLDEGDGAPRAEEIVRRRGITHILAQEPDRPVPPEAAERPTLEMRLLAGRDLPEWLERDEGLTEAMRVRYVLDVPPLDDLRAATRRLEGTRTLVVYRVKPTGGETPPEEVSPPPPPPERRGK